MLTRREDLDKQKKAIMAKDIVTKNPVFTPHNVDDFFELFALYADSRTKRADIRDIVGTAKSLGMDTKYRMIFNAMITLSNNVRDNQIDFETFLSSLTQIMGNPYDEAGRRAIYNLADPKGNEFLEFEDLKKLAEQFKYGISDDELRNVITTVGGPSARSITWDNFNAYVQKKVEKRK